MKLTLLVERDDVIHVDESWNEMDGHVTRVCIARGGRSEATAMVRSHLGAAEWARFPIGLDGQQLVVVTLPTEESEPEQVSGCAGCEECPTRYTGCERE